VRWWWFVSFCLASAAWADANVSVRVDVATREVKVGQRFRVDVVVSVDGQDQLDDVTLPDLPDLEIDAEAEIPSVHMVNINGRRAVKSEHRTQLTVHATKPGKKVIQGAAAVLGTTRATAPPITIQVVGPDGTTGAPADDDKAAEDQVDDDTLSEEVLPAQAGKERMFLFTRVTPSRAVVGQQVTLVTELWSTIGIRNVPSLGHEAEGFYRIHIDGDGDARVVQARGTQYRVTAVAKDALFGLRPGDFSIAPLRLQVDGGFGRSAQTLRGQSVQVHIDDAPANVLVGQWTLKRELVGARPGANGVNNARVGDVLTVRTTLQGRGHIDAATLPTLPAMDARTFAPQRNVKRSTVNHWVTGTLVQEELLSPSMAGELLVPSMSIAVFDPMTQTNQSIEVPGMRITVAPAGVVAGTKQKEARTKSAAIQWHEHAQAPPWMQALRSNWMIAVTTSLLAIAAALQWSRQRQRTEVKSMRVDLRAQARAAAQQGDLVALVAVVHAAIEESGHAHSAGMSAEHIERNLAHPRAADIAAFLRAAEHARYAPGQQTRPLSQGVHLVDALVADAPTANTKQVSL
jgi:hypothetical protein